MEVRLAHNQKVVGSSPTPAITKDKHKPITKDIKKTKLERVCLLWHLVNQIYMDIKILDIKIS